MAWWIQPLEIKNDETPGIKKWRLTAKSDEDGGGPFGLCKHEHDSPQEAQQCPEARTNAEKY